MNNIKQIVLNYSEWFTACSNEHYVVRPDHYGVFIAYSQTRAIVGKWIPEESCFSSGVDYGWVTTPKICENFG
jgi:hypothetical protein